MEYKLVGEEELLRRYITHASETAVQDLLAASRPELQDGWRLFRIKRGVEICRKKQGRVKVVRGQCIVDVSASEFQSLTSVVDTCKRWDPHFVEGHYLQTVGDNLDILRLVFSGGAGPLFRNRDFIVYERRETMDDGTQVVAVASLPKELAELVYPEGGRHVRGYFLQSGWVIEQAEEDSDACLVTYVSQVDPGGWIPKWLVNILSVRLVLVIDDLYKLAQSLR